MSEIVVGVSGGIAAYKAASLVRLFTESGHHVTVVPTEAALKFVGAPTWEALSGRPVRTDVFEDVHEVPHVRLGQHADLVVVAPATANLLAKAAHGLADDLLTNTLLTARCPVVMAPAMHTEMWEHAATRTNVDTLRSRGVVVLEPASGRLTGVDTGKGRLPEPEEIFAACLNVLESRPQDLAGKHVVVSAGGTREYLDPVRFLGNRSSGRQGYALAEAAVARGATVTVVAANVSLPDPAGAEIVQVVSTEDLRREVLLAAADADAVVMAAAPADFRPDARVESKIKKTPDGDAPRSTSSRTPTSWPSWCARGSASARSSSASPPRPATRTARCSTTPARSSSARAATSWSSTTSAASGCSAATTTRPSSSAPTARSRRWRSARRSRWLTRCGTRSPTLASEPHRDARYSDLCPSMRTFRLDCLQPSADRRAVRRHRFASRRT